MFVSRCSFVVCLLCRRRLRGTFQPQDLLVCTSDRGFFLAFANTLFAILALMYDMVKHDITWRMAPLQICAQKKTHRNDGTTTNSETRGISLITVVSVESGLITEEHKMGGFSKRVETVFSNDGAENQFHRVLFFFVGARRSLVHKANKHCATIFVQLFTHSSTERGQSVTG